MFGLCNIAIFLPTVQVDATITIEFQAELIGETLVQVYKTTFFIEVLGLQYISSITNIYTFKKME